ncbi:MAG: type IX secretion system membrane protein PorP/SprF [Bacteroidia bacterium]
MKRIYTLVLLLIISLPALAQDPEFTQFYANPLYLNPAFAGTAKGPRVAMNYRNQWSSISSGFVTYAASYDQHFDRLGGGIGLQAWYDKAGDGELSNTVFSGMYSYHLNVTREFAIKAGLQASMYTRSIDFNKLKWGDQIDARRGFVFQTQEPIPGDGNGVYTDQPFVDFSAGMLGFTENFFVGFAVNHITEPNQSFYANPESVLPRKYTGHAGFLIPIEEGRNPEDFISPNILFQRQGNFTQVNFGAYVIKGPFVAGAWFRQTGYNSDAFMALIGLKKDILKVGYSYDLTVSDARSAARGSHEISLILEFEYNQSSTRGKWKGLNCPTF